MVPNRVTHHAFVNFTEKERSTKFHGVFDNFSSSEVTLSFD